MAKKSSFSFLHLPISPLLAFGLIAVVFIATYFYFFAPVAQPLDINQVGIGGQIYTVPSCNKNDLDNLTLSQPCGPHGFYAATYRCAGSRTDQNIASRTCQTISKLQSLAEQACPDVCPKPSFSPNPSSSPRIRCLTRPACLDNDTPCKITLPADVVLCSPTPKPVASSTPVASCVPRPACLDARPACMIPITDNMCLANPSQPNY